MSQVDIILERFKENEELAQKFHEVETSILSILNFKDFHAGLLSQIGEKFDVPLVWLTILEDTEVLTLIDKEEGKKRLNIIDQETFAELSEGADRPVLSNNIKSCHMKLLPPDNKALFQSIAVLPLVLDGNIVGSLNLADFSADRFQPDLDTIFLERLIVKVSICLSNVVAHEKLIYAAHHDPLTGLVNRRLMEELLAQEILRCKRYESPLSLVFIDLDDFKPVNDVHGHDVGDLLLKYVADTMLSYCRDSDVVVRIAGDEFVILLPETDVNNAEGLMSRLQAFFTEAPFPHGEYRLPVSLSYGIVTLSDTGDDNPTSLLKRADKLLYENKRAKKASKQLEA